MRTDVPLVARLVPLLVALAPTPALADPAASQTPDEPAAPQTPAAVAPAPTPAPPPETAPPRRRRVHWYDVAPGDPRRFSLAANLQVDLLGLAVGIRPEFLYRPFRATRGFNLRFGFGLLGGPEYFFLPVDVGWRQHFVPHHRVTLELGAGYEQQSFFVRDAPPVTRGYFYAELGLAVRVASRGWLGVQFAPGWAPFSHPGPGVATRLGFRWDLGDRPNRATAGRRRM